jgi:hypothetical protein
MMKIKSINQFDFGDQSFIVIGILCSFLDIVFILQGT